MAELHVVEDERPGILKEIDEGAMDLIFQAIQEDIYSHPIQSFVREAISNGLDAITERHIFEAISGGHPQEKYFLQRQDGKLLKDSEFTPEYYDKNYLSSNSKVLVTYIDREGRDLITIRDNGVGLGGKRLQGFFKLGYSSKRNMKDVIGKFGAGAKAGLATGVDYFVVHTIYNGYRTSFMVFKNDFDPITPKADNSRIESWEVKMANGDIETRFIYWEPTYEKNGVQVDLEVKKHNKERYLSAVTEQFQYFNGRVTLQANGVLNIMNEKPHYESKTLLIPQFSTYSSPHILVDGISYGLISWAELELENRTGKIAIKVKATEVDITQSRESLKWTEKTKATILTAIENTKEEAANHLAKAVSEQDRENIFKLNDSYGNLKKDSDNIVKTVFSKFLDVHNMTPKFSFTLGKVPVSGYLSEEFFEFLFYSFNCRRLSLINSKGKTLIDKSPVSGFRTLQNAKIIFAEETSVGPKLVAHLLNKYNVSSLVYIRPGSTRIKTSLDWGTKTFPVEDVKEFSLELLRKYATLNVDNYDVKYDESEEDLEVHKENKEALSVLRKANQEVYYTYYRNKAIGSLEYDHTIGEYTQGLTFNQEAVTTKISSLESFEDKKIVICTGKYKDLGKILELTQVVFPSKETKIRVIYVAQNVVHHFAPYGITIDEYFRKVNLKTGELMVGEHLKNLNTWRMCYDLMQKYRTFGKNYELLKAITAIDVDTLQSINVNSREFDPRKLIENGSRTMSEGVLDDIFGYLRSIQEFQAVVETADKELIAEKAQILFNSSEIYHIDAYDTDFIKTLESELERINSIEPILKNCQENYSYSEAQPLFDLLLTTIENTKL